MNNWSDEKLRRLLRQNSPMPSEKARPDRPAFLQNLLPPPTRDQMSPRTDSKLRKLLSGGNSPFGSRILDYDDEDARSAPIGDFQKALPQLNRDNVSGVRTNPYIASRQELRTASQENSFGLELGDPSEEKSIYLFHDHFSCSEHDHAHRANGNQSPTKYRDGELWEADTYRYEFNFGIFAKALTISFGYINTFINYFGWINMVLVIYSIYQNTWIYGDAKTLNYMVGLLFLSIIGASEMSFINSKIPKLLETVKLSGESCRKAGALREVRIQDELKRTILRLDFDASSFFMSFIENTEDNAALFPRKIPLELQDPDLTDIKWLADPEEFRSTLGPSGIEGIKEEEDRLILEQRVSKSNLIATAMKFERAVFYLEFLTSPCRYDNKKAYAYRYARDILEAYKDAAKYPYALFLTLAGVIGTVVVSFVKFNASDLDPLDNVIIGYIGKGALLITNAIVTFTILYLISEGTHMIWNRRLFVKGLADLISVERPPEATIFMKFNKMINIFDFESLRPWASLRMIFMNLNQKRLESISLAISIIVAIQLTTISVLGFFYFTAGEPEKKAFFLHYIIFFGTPTIIYMIFVLLFISIGAQVNNQYQEHIYRLKTLKITIYKLFALYPTFVGKKRIQPSTYILARGLRYLQGLFGEGEVPEEVLEQKLAKINEAYDTIIAELEVEEQHHPLKLLGIPMTDSFAGTVFGTILTVLMIPVGKYLAEITGWG